MFVSVYCKLLLLLPIRKFNDAERKKGGEEEKDIQQKSSVGRGEG